MLYALDKEKNRVVATPRQEGSSNWLKMGIAQSLLDFVSDRCYCGYLSKMKLETNLNCIPEFCIWCKFLNDYCDYLDKKTIMKPKDKKGGR